MKKTLSLILAMLMVLSTMSCLTVVSLGADSNITEVEENDTAVNAQLIEVDKTQTGVSEDVTDVDWYKFENTKDYFVFNFEINEEDFGSISNNGWNVYIYDSNLEEIASFSNSQRFVSAKIAFTGIIYVKIKLYNKVVDSVKYDFKSEVFEDAHWESEYNNKSTDANLINTNETYTGSMYTNYDVDWYKFEADKDYFTIDFSYVDTGDLARGWVVKIYDGNLNLLKTYSDYKKFTSAKLSFSGIIYVSVESSNGYYDTLNNVNYQLKVTTVEDAHWESEYNDDSTSPNLINSNETYTGSLYTNSDVDWYKFESDKDYFTIDFSYSETGDLTRGWAITIYDSNLNTLKTYSDYKQLTSAIIPVSGTIYVSVKAANSYYDTLNDLYYNLTANTYTNVLWENEYNSTSVTADTIEQNTIYKGTLMSATDVDFYKFKATSSAFKIKFTIDLNETELSQISKGWKISVYPVDSAESIVGEYIVNSIGSFETRTLPYEKGKEYFVKVQAVNDYGSYPPVDAIYNISAIDASNGDKWEVEKGKADLSSATSVNSGDKIYGNLYDGNDKDYYKIFVPASGKINVKFNRNESENAGYGWKFHLVDGVGSVIETVDLGNSLNGNWTSKVIAKEGNYYIKMECVNSYHAPSSEINYNLTFNYAMTVPKLSSVANATNGVELEWSKVNGCAGYYVYRKEGNGSFKKIATVKGATKDSYTDKSAKNGKTYTYKVKAYDGKITSADSATKKITFISAPKAKSIATAKAGVTFTWNKVTGATGYEVYRATGNGNFNKIVTVKKGSVVKFVDKSAKKGTTYKYKVRATKGSSTSAFSGVKTIKDKY